MRQVLLPLSGSNSCMLRRSMNRISTVHAAAIVCPGARAVALRSSRGEEAQAGAGLRAAGLACSSDSAVGPVESRSRDLIAYRITDRVHRERSVRCRQPSAAIMMYSRRDPRAPVRKAAK